MTDILYSIKQVIDAFLEWKYSFRIMAFLFLDVFAVYICYIGIKVVYKYFVKVLNCLKNICLIILFLAYYSIFIIFEDIKCLIDTKVKVWYILWFTLASFYLREKWSEAMVFYPFNGNSLILCCWLVLIFKPFIEEVDTPWFKTKFNKRENDVKRNKNNYRQELEQINEDERIEKQLQSAQEKENFGRILRQSDQQEKMINGSKE